VGRDPRPGPCPGHDRFFFVPLPYSFKRIAKNPLKTKDFSGRSPDQLFVGKKKLLNHRLCFALTARRGRTRGRFYLTLFGLSADYIIILKDLGVPVRQAPLGEGRPSRPGTTRTRRHNLCCKFILSPEPPIYLLEEDVAHQDLRSFCAAVMRGYRRCAWPLLQ